jgi:hypothetical protein
VGTRALLFLSLSIAAATFAGTGTAHASTSTSKAEALVNQAVELRRSGDDQAALPLLQQAYALGHAPRAAGQLGLCEQALGQWADAEGHLLEALKADADPWVKKSRRVLEDALVIVKSHIARVEVQGEPEGAEVLINGLVVGKLPLSGPVRVAAGELEIELRAPGFAREAKTLRLDAGQYQRVVLRASKPGAPPPVPVPAPAAPAPAPVVNVEVQVPAQPAPAASSGPAGLVVARWVALGLGAAGLGVGVFGAVQRSSRLDTFDESCSLRMGVPVNDVTGLPDPTCNSKKSAYESSGTLAIVGFAAGGALVATGVVLWLLAPRPSAAPATAFACAPGVDAAGVSLGCAARF